MQISLIELLIIVLVLSIVLFLCFYMAFRAGIKLGMRTGKGLEPKPIKTPAKIVKEIRQNKEKEKANKVFNKGLQNIFSYTGDVKDGDK